MQTSNGVKTLRDFNLKGKRVLVRCDFNVPLSLPAGRQEKRGEIAKRTSSSSLPSLPPEMKVLDDFRIRKTIPTIKYLIKKGAKVVLMSHLGRPEGRQEKYSLKPIAKRLEKLLKKKVKFLDDCIGEKVEKEIEKMKEKDVILLENLRFHKEEEENETEFAKDLSKLGQIYLNDAFAVCHRSHASVVGIPKYLPSGIGLLLEKEIENLKKIIEKPPLPLVAIFGGREANFRVINKISKIAKAILIGFLIKKEIEREKIALKYPKKIIFPIDGVDKKGENFDIGPRTIDIFKKEISKAKTIFWSGPLGKIEEKKFQRGTKEIAKAIIESGAFSVIGGGETIEFLNKIGLAKKFSHLSTGGSAMLAFLAGEKLPGIEALK
jgi:3-phosphoglycerate kinase